MFSFFPNVKYKVSTVDEFVVKDITLYNKIRNNISALNGITFRQYVIQNGERPDTVSHRVYGIPTLDYVILITNGISNIYEEWPMSYAVFNNYIEAKYGTMQYATSNIAKYYTSFGDETTELSWLSLVDSKKYTKTYFEYESDLNLQKSKINLLEFTVAQRFEVEARKAFFSLGV